jgi:hypothetical protein
MTPVSASIKQGEKSQKKAIKYFGTGYTVISKMYRLGRHLESVLEKD